MTFDETTRNGSEGQEIERKFLVKKLPNDIENYDCVKIRQGYLKIESGVEERIRQKGDQYYKTCKKGEGLVREEREEEISQTEFEELWPQTLGMRVEKTRYFIPVKGTVVELDVYEGDLSGKIVAELELNRQDDSVDLNSMDWLDEEVTGKSEYSNAALAENGWPEKGARAEELELEQGVNRLIEMINQKIENSVGRPVIVQIAGGSASGKTSAVADRVRSSFGDNAVIISMDDYYRGLSYMAEQEKQGNKLNFDQPEVLNLDELKQNLALLKNGETINEPIYSFVKGERVGSRPVSPAKVIIVEGLFALNDSLIVEGDVHAFVDIGTHGRIIRRLLRDVERTGQNPKDILDYFADVVEPMHGQHIQSTKHNADIIINNEYMPEIEAKRAERWENQLKFRTELNTENIRRTGAEQISRSHQVDTFYDPAGKRLQETGEMLRIREESGYFQLTYKGPKSGGAFRSRPKFEFEIDSDTRQKLLSLYTGSVVIKKDRILFQLDGVMFSLDTVTKRNGDDEKELGQFVEIRNSGQSPEVINKIIKKLGLDISQGITDSYLEME